MKKLIFIIIGFCADMDFELVPVSAEDVIIEERFVNDTSGFFEGVITGAV